MTKNSKKAPGKIVPQEATSGVVARIICLVSINILLIHLVRTSTSESWDKLIYVTSILFGSYALFSKAKIWRDSLFYFVSIIPLFIGVIGVEKHGTETTSGVDVSGLLWLGFGPVVLVVLVLIYPFIFKILDIKNHSSIMKSVLGLLATISVVLSCIGAWQTNISIIDPYSTEYVANEHLAVSAGHFPYVDFIPQYGTLISFIIAPLKNYLNPYDLLDLSFYVTFGLTIIAMLIGVVLVRQAFGTKSWILPILLVFPFTSVTHLPVRTGFAGSIFDLIQQLPLRLIPGMVLGLLLVGYLTNTYSNRIDTAYISLIGFLSGFTLWLNQDFAVLAGLITMFLLLVFITKIKKYFIGVAFYIIGIASYPAILILFGEKVLLKYVGFFAIQYSGGFMAESIKIPGPVLVVLPAIVAIVLVSSQILVKARLKKKTLEVLDQRALLIACYFSLWCLGGFLYYLNRSYASGQMQILFLPLAVAAAALIAFIQRSEFLQIPWTPSSAMKSKFWTRDLNRNLALGVSVLLVALPIATTVALPDPRIELKRINNAPIQYKWPKAQTSTLIEYSKEIKRKNLFEGKKLGFFGASGNYIELMTGIESVNILNSPWDIPVTQTTIKTGCEAIFAVNPDILLVGPEGPALFRFNNNSLCNAYQYLSVPGFPDGTFAQKISN
jgi:hypothetical protein